MTLAAALWDWLTYSAYDRDGRFILLADRVIDPKACQLSGVPEHLTDAILTAICESMDIPLEQRGQMRLDDRIGDYYRTMSRGRFRDDLECVRLGMGPFDFPPEGCDPTIRDLLTYASARIGAHKASLP